MPLENKVNSRLNLARLFITIALIGFAVGVFRNLQSWYIFITPDVSRLPVTLILVIVYEIILFLSVLFITWRPGNLSFFIKIRDRLGLIRFFLIGFLVLIPLGLLYRDRSGIFEGSFIHISLFLFFSLGAVLLASKKTLLSWSGVFSGLILFFTCLAIMNGLFKASDYPFSLTWSEGNRIWDYSTFYASYLYNTGSSERIKTLTDIGRTSLWGLPFLIPGVKIQIVRIWDVVVFSFPYMILGWSIFSYEKNKNWKVWLIIGLMAFLYLHQGPIYTPLVLAAILIALVKNSPLWISIPVLILSSFYAMISRYTWVFAPLMWIIMWDFVKNYDRSSNLFSNLKKSVLFFVSGIFGGIVLPNVLKNIFNISLNFTNVVDTDVMTKSITQHPLLWDRLIKNPTFGQGVIANILIATIPIILVILLPLIMKKWELSVWQKIAVVSIQIPFLVVGLIVSVKAGGGNNLHNLDMYLIGLLFAAGLAWSGGLREFVINSERNSLVVNLIILALIIIPSLRIIFETEPLFLPSGSETNMALEAIKRAVTKASQEGEVLFMDQRQLLTFGYVDDVPMVLEYEKKVMMNAALAENSSYLNNYYQDLKSRRFSLIISEPLNIKMQDNEIFFSQENNAWVKWVTIPTACYYRPIYISSKFNIELLAPRYIQLKTIGDYSCP